MTINCFLCKEIISIDHKWHKEKGRICFSCDSGALKRSRIRLYSTYRDELEGQKIKEGVL